MNDQATIKFISLISDLFQLKDAESTDHGIYKVICAHNERIAKFLGTVNGDNFTPASMSQIINDVLSIGPNAKLEA